MIFKQPCSHIEILIPIMFAWSMNQAVRHVSQKINRTLWGNRTRIVNIIHKHNKQRGATQTQQSSQHMRTLQGPAIKAFSDGELIL
jgi:hypothetical protein